MHRLRKLQLQKSGMYLSCIVADLTISLLRADAELAGEAQGLTEEKLAELRSQLDSHLRDAAGGPTAGLSDETALAQGREVWARCEALTAGGSRVLPCS